ncbi:antigen WC1.1-like [Dendronephthya gigantea]|uniref:antigen WC1.1-like n=1 Tax=Dendronephthya gigantea TaxID=151771 RepID=UPI00106AEBB4|nr:antigen WC1.1-like [Dendronephthya gigantea]
MRLTILFLLIMFSVSRIGAWHQWYPQNSSFIQGTPIASSISICRHWQFRCDNGYQCVDRYYLCNGRRECSDGSDEWSWNCVSETSTLIQPSSTASQTVCRYWQFRCNNGYQCIDRYYLCNGRRECSDGSDEWSWNCVTQTSTLIQPSSTVRENSTLIQPSSTASQTICRYWEFRCNNGYQCIHRYYLCNGWRECSDGSDEWSWNCGPSSSINPTPTSSIEAKSSAYGSFKDIRIVGSINDGRVEVYYNGRWGTVCDDSWDMNDARVVCRQLGFQDAEAAYQGGNVRDGTGQIWLDQVNCRGSESSLFLCRHPGWGIHDCSHSEDAGVRCKVNGGPSSSIDPTPTSSIIEAKSSAYGSFKGKN